MSSGYDQYGRPKFGAFPLGEKVPLGPLQPPNTDQPAGSFYMPRQPLDARRLVGEQRLGVTPVGNRAPTAPLRWPPLAGQPQAKRGNTIRVDSSQLNRAQPNGAPGYAQETTIVEVRSAGDDAENILVNLGFDASIPIVPDGTGRSPLANFDTRCKARITWGVGSSSYEVLCDFRNGTQLSVTANYCRVNGIVPDNTSLYPQNVPIFLLSAGFASGTPPAVKNRATLTTPCAAGSTGTNLIPFYVLTIPDFATGFNVIGAFGNAQYLEGPFQLQQYDSGQSGLILYTSFYQPTTNFGGQCAGWFPVGNGANVLRVTNLMPGGVIDNTSILWELAL